MDRHADQKCVNRWTAAGIATIATLWVGCSGSVADDAPPEAVRNAAEQHVGEAGGEMTFDDTLVVEDTVIHKVSGKNVLFDARRAELDRKG